MHDNNEDEEADSCEVVGSAGNKKAEIRDEGSYANNAE